MMVLVGVVLGTQLWIGENDRYRGQYTIGGVLVSQELND
jgi:hypothetical protein